MTPQELQQLHSLLMGNEGLKLKIYADSVGIPTIGIGRNLRDKGITQNEAFYLLDNDITECVGDLVHAYSWFLDLSLTRQHALIDLRFNLGMAGFAGFRQMITALSDGRFDDAATQLLSSQWAGQVGKRATDLASMLRAG